MNSNIENQLIHDLNQYNFFSCAVKMFIDFINFIPAYIYVNLHLSDNSKFEITQTYLIIYLDLIKCIKIITCKKLYSEVFK